MISCMRSITTFLKPTTNISIMHLYFDYAPAPPQGRWRIYGLGLCDGIIKKVYYENAARLLQIPG
jgi:hypothetical protein